MLHTQLITARKLLRNYKQVVEEVNRTKKPTIVTSNNEKQVAIIPVEDLQDLEKGKAQKSGQALLNLSQLFDPKKKSNTPKDLATNHDYYAWGGEKNKKS
jgi:prevent-host-death family protein